MIEHLDETNQFLDRVENYTGVRLPKPYVSKSKIVGVFLHKKMVAGYMIVTQPSFRSVLFVPDEIKAISSFFNIDQFEMMEVNGLWIGPGLKTPSLQIRVWLHLIKDIFSCRKKYVLLMRNIRNRNMERFLGMANPNSLYKGAPVLMAGDVTHQAIEVSYTTRWSIVLNTHKYLLELLHRQRRAARNLRYKSSIQDLKRTEPHHA